jgi:L-lactate utilization protein LutB
MLHRRLFFAFAALTAALALAPRADAREWPHMVAALGEMKEARNELREAAHDFGGHRAKALESLDYAIEQMDKALRAVGVDGGYVPPAREVYRGYKNFPHIHHALTELRSARTQMKEAATDFKGHKAKAIEAVDAAIVQLERAVKFAK